MFQKAQIILLVILSILAGYGLAIIFPPTPFVFFTSSSSSPPSELRESMCLCSGPQMPHNKQVINPSQKQARINACDIPEHMIGVV